MTENTLTVKSDCEQCNFSDCLSGCDYDIPYCELDPNNDEKFKCPFDFTIKVNN